MEHLSRRLVDIAIGLGVGIAVGYASVTLVALRTPRESRRDAVKHDRPSRRKLPRRIVLIRHGESIGNVDKSRYFSTPNSDL